MKINNSTLSDDVFVTVENLLPNRSFPTYHAHNVFEIYILKAGERNFYVGNKLYQTIMGDAALICPHIPHRSFGTTPYSGICIEFTAGYIKNQCSKHECSELLKCFTQPIISLEDSCLQQLWEKAELVIAGALDPKTYLLHVLHILNEYKEETNLLEKLSVESDTSPIATYLQEHYKEIKCLDELAVHFEISKSYLCRVFKQQTGLTIVEYLNRLKVEEAYKLLQETELPIHAISQLSGFDTVIHFNRIFKRIMGNTPREARKLALNQWTYI